MHRLSYRLFLLTGTLAGSVLIPALASPPHPAGQRLHWAYRPITRVAPPSVRRSDWVRNPIDAFVLARLEREGITPSSAAEREVLFRRVALDLTGLPSSPAELDRALADTSPAAYERWVDRLLASPAYGERWARHWLDLARYSDTDGYGPDRLRPYAWRWRDWVIQSLNEDLPFDRFTVLQLAGDLVPHATDTTRLATGFQRHTLANREAGADPEESRVKAVKDRVNTLGAVWLGLTVACAECHDHKYDPLLQREYYQLYSFWDNAEERDAAVPAGDRDREVFQQAQKSHAAHRKDLEADLSAYRARLQQTLPDFERSLTAQTQRAAPGGDLPAPIREVLRVPVRERTPAQQAAMLSHYEAVDGGAARRRSALQDHQLNEPKPDQARIMVLAERERDRRRTTIQTRGDFLKPGDPTEPGVPAILPPFRARGPRPDRLDLAEWLVRPNHPLTARVAVNRIWGRLFGEGIVPTVEDFGSQGERPSHPELLDWLANRFSAPAGDRDAGSAGVPGLGWSQKGLIRLVVTSATYRQSSRQRRDLQNRDPANRWLARQNRFRLDAESVRDGALAASGLLRTEVGGPSFRPPLPRGVAEVAFRLDLSYTPDQGEVLNRRSLYIFTKRNLPNPVLTTLDAPDAAVTCARRMRTNTPLQALTLLNDPQFAAAARALADRIQHSGSAGDAPRLEYGFRLATGRRPAPAEAEILRALLHDLRRLYTAEPREAASWLSGTNARPRAPAAEPDPHAQIEAAAWGGVARALLNMDGFLCRE